MEVIIQDDPANFERKNSVVSLLTTSTNILSTESPSWQSRDRIYCSKNDA